MAYAVFAFRFCFITLLTYLLFLHGPHPVLVRVIGLLLFLVSSWMSARVSSVVVSRSTLLETFTVLMERSARGDVVVVVTQL
jgi:hypothetical protein